MGSNAYNDLWVILDNMPESEAKRVPAAFREFVKTAMDPDVVSEVDVRAPLEEQALSAETRSLLASLSLTYWANGTSERRELAEKMYRNELAFQGLAEAEMTEMSEDDYQAVLASFDEWNELFGPIPFWPASRGWVPEECFEVVSEKCIEEAPEGTSEEYLDGASNGASEKSGPVLQLGDFCLRSVYVTPEQRARFVEEAKEWVLVAEIEGEEVYYWHDDYRESWTSTREIADFYRKFVAIKDGHFYGALLRTTKSTGMGMAHYRDEEFGILCVDGRKCGRTEEYEHRSSSETSYEETVRYSLKKVAG